jgi:hypothetical protein
MLLYSGCAAMRLQLLEANNCSVCTPLKVVISISINLSVENERSLSPMYVLQRQSESNVENNMKSLKIHKLYKKT